MLNKILRILKLHIVKITIIKLVVIKDQALVFHLEAVNKAQDSQMQVRPGSTNKNTVETIQVR